MMSSTEDAPPAVQIPAGDPSTTSMKATSSKAPSQTQKARSMAECEEMVEEATKRTWAQWAKANVKVIIFLIVLAGLITYLAVDMRPTDAIKAWLNSFLVWVENNPALGFFVFVIVYMLCTVAFIPGSVLTLGAGLTFVGAFGAGPGLAAAIGAVFLGAWCGAQIAFFAGRYFFTKYVQRLTESFPVMKAIDSVFEKEGIKLNALLRTSPVVPFSAFNYVMGGTSSSWRDYAIGTCGIIPGTALYCYIGALPVLATGSGSASQQEKIVKYSTIAAGGVLTVVAVVLITIYAKRTLTKTIKEQEEAKAQAEADTAGDMEKGKENEGDVSGEDTSTSRVQKPTESYACDDYGQLRPVKARTIGNSSAEGDGAEDI